MVGHEAPQQPQQLQIAPGLALEPPARLHAVEIAIDIELQENRGVEGGTSGRCGLNTVEAEAGKIERIDKRIDHANRIFLVDPVIEALRQKRRLSSICSLDEPLHDHPRKSSMTMSASAAVKLPTTRSKSCRNVLWPLTVPRGQPLGADVKRRVDQDDARVEVARAGVRRDSSRGIEDDALPATHGGVNLNGDAVAETVGLPARERTRHAHAALRSRPDREHRGPRPRSAHALRRAGERHSAFPRRGGRERRG